MGDLKFYFVDFLGRNYKQWENTYKEQSIAEHLVNIPGEWEVVYLGAEQEHYVSNPIAQFLNPRLKKDHILLLNTTSPLNLFSPESSLVFLFLPEQESYLNAIQLFYPHGEIIEERGGYERTLYWLYVYRP